MKQDSSVRQILVQKAELIGMVRLPNTTFQSLTTATVTTDIVFLQKRDASLSLTQDNMPEWIEVDETPGGVPVNRYYLSILKCCSDKCNEIGAVRTEKTSACILNEGHLLLPALEIALGTLEARFPDLPDEVAQTENILSPSI